MGGESPYIGHGHPEFFESMRGGRGGHFHGHGRGPHHGGSPGLGAGPHAELFAGRGRGGRGRGGFHHGGRGRHSSGESEGEYAEFVERFREMSHGPRKHGRRREREGPVGDETPKGYNVESDSEGFVDVDGERKEDDDGEAKREAPNQRGWSRRGHHWHGHHAHGFDEPDFAPRHGGPGGFDFYSRRGGRGPHGFTMGHPPHDHFHHLGRHGHFKKPFPRVDISVSEAQYVLEIEIPGVRKDNINALVGDDGQSITVEGTFPTRAEDTLERVHVERRVAPGEKFERTIPLPGLVDKESVRAKLADGVLTITLVKAPKEEPQGRVVNIE